MEVHVNKTPGLRNDLLITLPRAEIDGTLLHIAHRDWLMELPGLTRHRDPTSEEREKNRKCKIPMEDHLKRLGVLDSTGKPLRRVIAVGNRNLGNNHGFIAWQRDQASKWFHVQGDPLNYLAYSCLVASQNKGLSIGSLRFDFATERVYRADNHADITDEVEWATFGQWVLRAGRVVSIEDLIDQFYDIRHVLAYDPKRDEGKKIEADIYRDYPGRFREQALRALWQQGVPRNRYLHNCIGLSADNVIILQREGTIEEVAQGLRETGAEDGVILDNGGSVACWAWWVYPSGGFIFTAPDYRPPATSIIAFVLKGPVQTHLPGGSVSYTVV